ncbi:MAG: flagellar hook-length control protein FliK, partial [Desulfobacterales bacterium]|nr:flagellar hook-length control protein FliK [Desulfobacterales bacterium]
MIESNLVNLKQGIGLPGSSEKLQKGNTGKEQEQLLPFLCIMGQLCRTTTQSMEKVLLNSPPGKGKMCGPLKKGDTNGQRGFFNIDPENNILSAGKGKTEKTNQLLPTKGKGLAESLRKVILKDGTTEDLNLFMNASKGKGTKTDRSFSGKINLPSRLDGQKQINVEDKNLPCGSALKEKAGGIHLLMEAAPRPQKSGLNKAGIEAGMPKRVEADALIGDFGERALHSGMRNGKDVTAVLNKSRDGINNVLIRGQRVEGEGQKSEGKGQSAKMKDAPGVLKFSLNNTAAVKGKSAAEPDKTEKNSFTLTKNDSDKNEIKNILRHSGLKSGETIEILHRETSLSEHSSDRSFSRGFPAGGYHNATFHTVGSSSGVNERVNSQAVEPRILINQIASGVNGPGRVRITLNPPHLGTLDVDVVVRDNKVHVMLQPENNDVRQILQSNVESLKSSLRNHGLVADTINVSIQEKSDGANYGADYRSGQNETLFREGGKWEGNQEGHGGAQDSVNYDPILFE